MPDKPQHISARGLKERGWSDRLIADLLGDPDKTARNPRYRSAASMRLWLFDRVVVAEADTQFQDYQESRQKRSQAMLAAAEGKRQELFARIDELPIRIARRTEGDILAASLQSWRDRKSERGDYAADGRDASDEVRRRWAVNFIRHNLTNYDYTLYAEIAGQIGAAEAALLLKHRILGVIAETYPEFAAEAIRQQV